MNDNRPIGVFDSGLGGLTVYKALKEVLPDESFIYLGDTARLPYGTKSAETVTQYALQAARRLVEEDIKLLVVACNTASAQALPGLKKALPELPCFGVIEPGARAAAEASSTGQIAVLATEGTVRSEAYPKHIRQYNPHARVHSLACNLLVALVEEGWHEGPEAEAIVGRYFRMLKDVSFDTLVLGCTHFPLVKETIRKFLPGETKLVDSATTVAKAVREYLNGSGKFKKSPRKEEDRFLVTDAPERFRRLAKRFLPGANISAVEQVDPVISR